MPFDARVADRISKGKYNVKIENLELACCASCLDFPGEET